MNKRFLEETARAERTAEQNRTTAETRWRSAWWATTLALAAVPKDEVTAAFDVAAKILSQTREYLSKRRVAGQFFSALEGDGLEALPPRLSMEYARAGGNPSGAAAYLTNAEATGVSLRDLAAELGTQPKSWQRADEQSFTEDEVAAAVAQLPPAARAGIAASALADPDVADAAFNRTQQDEVSRAALGNVAQAHHQGEQRRLAEKVSAMPPAARETDDQIGRVGAKLDLDEATLTFKAACTAFAETISAALPQAGPYSGGDGPMTYARLVTQTASAHETAGRVLEILASYVTSEAPGASLDDEIADLLGGH